MNKSVEDKFSHLPDAERYILHKCQEDLEAAREEFKDHWMSWTALDGTTYEGVFLCVEFGEYIVLCPNGEYRNVQEDTKGRVTDTDQLLLDELGGQVKEDK